MKERREDKEKIKELQQVLESKGSTAGSQAARGTKGRSNRRNGARSRSRRARSGGPRERSKRTHRRKHLR